MRSIGPAILAFCAAAEKRSFRLVPDQKSRSKSSLSVLTRLRANSLRKMAAQLAMDTTDQQQHDELHHPAGVEHELQDRQVLVHWFSASRMVCGILAGFRVSASTQPMRMVPSQSRVAAALQERLLGNYQRRTARFLDTGRNKKFIIEAGGPPVTHRGFPDNEDAARAFAQAALLDAQGAQPFGAGPLEELQVVGIEDDAAGVGVFPIDANGEFEGHRLQRSASTARSRATDSCSCAIELAVEKRTKSWVSCGAEIAARRHGHMGALHHLEGEIPAALDARASGTPASNRPRRRTRRRAPREPTGPWRRAAG